PMARTLDRKRLCRGSRTRGRNILSSCVLAREFSAAEDSTPTQINGRHHAATHPARSTNVNPRLLASVHISGSATEMLAIPPQAVWKFPSVSRFIAGGQGEWSVTTMLIAPSLRPCHSLSQFSRLRIGGAHLLSVALSRIVSAARCR